jgi:mannose-6-phosphate isomerase
MTTQTPETRDILALAPNTPQRFYRGGERILSFRGLPVPESFDGRRPEDWLASTTRLFAEGGDGLTVLPDGRELGAALGQEPDHWFGPDHLARHGAEPGLLVKLLDAGERLPVHSHPDRDFAARHLGCVHGKTEAWLVVQSDPGAAVWLGFREDIDPAVLADLVAAQDDRLLAALNRLEVRRGDAILVPAGQPHAIGAGVLVVELQEPTDLSVMLEHDRFGLDPDHAWLGLDPGIALGSVSTTGLTSQGLAALRTRWDGVAGLAPALPAEASEFFAAEVADSRQGPVPLSKGFSVLVVVDGAGTLFTAHGDRTPLRIGDVFLTPYAAGDLVVEGAVTVLRCSPARDPDSAKDSGSAKDRTLTPAPEGDDP